MSIQSRQAALVDDFNFFDNWTDKYTYLISLGKSLSPFPEDKKDEAHKVKGCQSQVWFDVESEGGKLVFYGKSDAAIVSGLIGLLLKAYNHASANEIINSDTCFMEKIGLSQHLSPTRNNGLAAMVKYIYAKARQYADEN